MKKLQNQCEDYIRENPDQFLKAEGKKAKFDFADQKLVVEKGSKKKDKGALDAHQAAACQALVIKKFRRTKKDIMF